MKQMKVRFIMKGLNVGLPLADIDDQRTNQKYILKGGR